MRFHAFVHDAQFVAQSVDVVLDIGLQGFNVHAVLVQCVKYLLFKSKARRFGFFPGLLVVEHEALAKLREKLTCHVCDDIQCRWLKVLEARMIEDLAD